MISIKFLIQWYITCPIKLKFIISSKSPGGSIESAEMKVFRQFPRGLILFTYMFSNNQHQNQAPLDLVTETQNFPLLLFLALLVLRSIFL